MRFASSISDSRSAVLVVACALASLLLADFYLYRMDGFTRHFGEATHDGQDLSKIRRGEALAQDADIIIFGGSFARYGVSGKPFLDNKILAWNYALSGGGAVSSYFALRSVAPILAKRKKKPIIVMEAFRDALISLSPHWAELVHLNGMARRPADLLSQAPLLIENAYESSVLESFFLQSFLPSSAYRSYVPQLYTNGLRGYWWYPEDEFGYAPMYDIDPQLGARHEALRPESIAPSRLSFLREFISLAKNVGARVVFMSSPDRSWLGAPDDEYRKLFEALKRDDPSLEFLPMKDYALTLNDFGYDGWGHPNVAGADKISNAMIRALKLRPTEDFDRKYAKYFRVIQPPDKAKWSGPFVARPEDGHTAFGYRLKGGGQVASFDTEPVPSGVELMVELQSVRDKGYLQLCLVQTGGYSTCTSDITGYTDKRLPKPRLYSRLRSMGAGNPIKILVNGFENPEGEVKSIRIVEDLAGAM